MILRPETCGALRARYATGDSNTLKISTGICERIIQIRNDLISAPSRFVDIISWDSSAKTTGADISINSTVTHSLVSYIVQSKDSRMLTSSSMTLRRWISPTILAGTLVTPGTTGDESDDAVVRFEPYDRSLSFPKLDDFSTAPSITFPFTITSFHHLPDLS
jgi:hypothetical protein